MPRFTYEPSASSRGRAGGHLVAGEGHVSSLPGRARRRCAARCASRCRCRPRRCGARRCRADGCCRGRARRVRRAPRPGRCRPGPAIAASGLKLRAALLKIRLPCRSPLRGVHEREVGDDRLLEHVLARRPADVEGADVLHRRGDRDAARAVVASRQPALGDLRADAGLRVERRDAGAAGAQLLGERALRRQLELELAGEELPLELLVLADVRRGHLADALGVQQDAETPVVDAAVVADDAEVASCPARAAPRSGRSGLPERPNPPTASDAPSGMSATASAADPTVLSITSSLLRRARRGRLRGAVHPILRLPGARRARAAVAMWMQSGVVSISWTPRDDRCPARSPSRAPRGCCGS